MLTVVDFQGTHALSTQVEQTKLNPAIADALRLDLAPRLGEELTEQLLHLAPAVVLAWPLTLADIVPGKYAERRGRVYKALVAQPDLTQDVPTTAASTAAWAYEPLRTLWHSYVKPYWKQAAWCRFLPTHGYNMDKAGLSVPTDPQGTFQPANPAHRASLQAAADNTADALLSQLLTYLGRHHSTTTDQPCGNAAVLRRKPIRGI